MSVDLLRNDVRNRYYHDLESVFLDFVYVCCICCGPNGALREDQSIFSTNIGKWYGKKGQSAIDIGNAKYATLNTKTAFLESIVPAIHPYFIPLGKYLVYLRDIVIAPEKRDQQTYREQNNTNANNDEDLDALVRMYAQKRRPTVAGQGQEDLPFELRSMEKRVPKEFFDRYKGILRKALADAALDERAIVDTAETGNAVSPPATGQLPPIPIVSALTRARQGEVPDDVLEHDTDLARPPALPPPSQQPPLLASSCSGKRKAGVSVDDSHVKEDSESEPPSPLRGKGTSSTLHTRQFLPDSHSRKLGKVPERKEISSTLSAGLSSKKQRIEG